MQKNRTYYADFARISTLSAEIVNQQERDAKEGRVSRVINNNDNDNNRSGRVSYDIKWQSSLSDNSVRFDERDISLSREDSSSCKQFLDDNSSYADTLGKKIKEVYSNALEKCVIIKE